MQTAWRPATGSYFVYNIGQHCFCCASLDVVIMDSYPGSMTQMTLALGATRTPSHEILSDAQARFCRERVQGLAGYPGSIRTGKKEIHQ